MDPQKIETPQLLKDLRPLISIIGQEYNIDPTLLEAVAWQETMKIPKHVKNVREGLPAKSRKGARGMMQIMPNTAMKDYDVTVGELDEDPVASLRIAAAELNRLNEAFGGNARQILTAYNMGKEGLATSGAMTGGTKVLDERGRAFYIGYDVDYNMLDKEAREYGPWVFAYMAKIKAEEELENAVSDSLFVGPPYE